MSVTIQRKNKAIETLCEEFKKYNYIDPTLYEKFSVKRGLRNDDGTGVLAGMTRICNVHGYIVSDDERVPIDGELIYRGYNIKDIINGCIKEDRFGFEETVYLLLFGAMPNSKQLEGFKQILAENRTLPDGFIDDMIMKAPSSNIMNKLARSVLALYSYDDFAEDMSLEQEMKKSIEIIARAPTIMVNAYQVKRRHYDNDSMFFHPSIKEEGIAESILSTLRSDRKYTKEEARLLDLCLILHAEHGGGNNSTFSCRVLTSSGTDAYSAYAAAIGSLKGPKHGGANIKVMEMLEHFKAGVKNWEDRKEVEDFIIKVINKKAGDGTGLIYGMGHAVYTKSDPRAIILKDQAMKLIQGTEYEAEFKLLQLIEELTPIAFSEAKGSTKVISANVDLYSGLVYKLLGLPEDLSTPLFAISRMAGWCAHRMEEINNGNRIIRPAYKAVAQPQEYVPLESRVGCECE
jgi:citrate synthase